MNCVTARQMKRLDAMAFKRYGIPALILMENAGRSAMQEALKMLQKKDSRRAAVFCGYGNNGGDGFVCARHLMNKGVKVDIYLVGKKKDFTEETRINYQILCKMKQKFRLIKGLAALGKTEKEIKKYNLIIDGIFGIGLRAGSTVFIKNYSICSMPANCRSWLWIFLQGWTRIQEGL